MLKEAQSQGIAVSLDASSTGAIADAGLQASREVIGGISPDMLVCNGEEAQLLGVSEVRQFATRTIIKNGPDPTVLISASGMSSHPVPKVDNVVDTTGAGDAFAAGYLVTVYLTDGSEQAAIAAGHKLSARTLTTLGATPI